MTLAVNLSSRAAGMPSSPIRRLAPLASAARAAGKTVYGLNIGQPDIPTPREVLDRLRSFRQDNVPYGPSEGLPEMLDVLHAYYRGLGLDVERSHLFVTTGGSEAILFVLASVSDPGDEVLAFEPFYTNYAGFSGLLGVRLVPVTTDPSTGYHLPPRAVIEARLSERTRAILICSPNNPTGTVYTAEELDLLADICRDRGLFLIADEVYREFTYDGRAHRSALSLPGLDDRVVVVDSLSKRLSVCGIRVGCIVTRNRDLLSAVLRCGQARLCPPTLGQYAALAMADVPASYMQRVVREYQARRDTIFEALTSTPGVALRRPEGAFYVCASLPVDDAARFAEFLLQDFDLDGETVMIAPADGFYATPGLGRHEARLAYVLEVEALHRAMRAFSAALQAYPGRT